MRLPTRFIVVSALALFIGLSLGCRLGGRGKQPTEFVYKQQFLKETAPSEAYEPELERLIRSRRVETGISVFPVSLAYWSDGTIYIADNNGNAIRTLAPVTSSISTLPAETGLGELTFPRVIREWENQVFVSDKDGIKVFKRDGRFERLLRTYLSVVNFAVASKDTVYINPYSKDNDALDALILELDKDGRRVKGFGRRINRAQHIGIEDTVFLGVTEAYVVAAFKYRPLIQIYDRTSGEIVREIKVTHPIFGKLAELAKSHAFVHPRPDTVVLPRFIADLSVIDNRAFVLLHLPYAEIVEFDLDGSEVARYRPANLPAAVDYFGIDLLPAGDSYKVATGILDTNSAALAEFSIPRSENREHAALRQDR